MRYQLVRKPASHAKRGPNVRTDYGDEAKTRALARSRAKCQVNPLVVRKDWTIIDGNRTHLGLELEGMLDVELDFIVTDQDLTPDQIKAMQVNSAFHRSDLPDFDKAVAMKDILAARPGMTKKQLAEEVLDADASQATRYLSVFECIPEAQEAAKSGKLSVSDWYAIAKLAPDDQIGLLSLKLSGQIKNRAELEAQGRKTRTAGTPATRASKLVICLVSGVKVTITGGDLSLDEAIDAVKDAQREMVKGRDQGLDVRTLAAVTRDKAKAGA